MSKKLPTVWEASPHTLAKISILKSYLDAYFQILGRTFKAANILYIDGFAGPGEYKGGFSGSPVTAMKAALSAKRTAVYAWEAGAIYLAFIELDKKRFEHLTDVLQQFDDEPEVRSGSVRYQVFSGTFVDQLPEVERWCPAPFRSREPLFAFIDPFGATGVPFAVVQKLLKTPSSEIFLNLDSDGITRLLEAHVEPANVAHLDDIFNTPAMSDSWRDHLHLSKAHKALFVDVLDFYKARLHNEAEAKYVFSFAMAKSDMTTDYDLVFASNHPLGLKKMKEAMKRFDPNGGYRFVDSTSRSGQEFLFRHDDPGEQAMRLFEVFKGQTVRYEDLRDWSLNHSAFDTPSPMLEVLQKKWIIEVIPKRGEKVNKGGFPADKVESIQFSSAKNDLIKPKK